MQIKSYFWSSVESSVIWSRLNRVLDRKRLHAQVIACFYFWICLETWPESDFFSSRFCRRSCSWWKRLTFDLWAAWIKPDLNVSFLLVLLQTDGMVSCPFSVTETTQKYIFRLYLDAGPSPSAIKPSAFNPERRIVAVETDELWFEYAKTISRFLFLLRVEQKRRARIP